MNDKLEDELRIQISELENQLSSMVNLRDLTIRDLKTDVAVLQRALDAERVLTSKLHAAVAALRPLLPTCKWFVKSHDAFGEESCTDIAVARGYDRMNKEHIHLCADHAGYYDAAENLPWTEPLAALDALTKPRGPS